MIIATRSGQLGNQIFQLAHAIAQRTGSQTIHMSDFADFLSCFTLPAGVRTFRFRDSRVARLLLRGLLLRTAAALRLISRIREVDHNGHVVGTARSSGLLPITWIDGGFYQHYRWAEQASDFLEFRTDIRSAAEHWLDERCSPGEHRIFCHVRRADYLNFQLAGSNLALPLSYYRDALQRHLAHKPDARIIFASDDVEFVELAFADIADALIIRENPCVTMAIMSLCDAGVISNSSFSWWPGLLVARRNGRVVAPRNWLGWADDICEPPGIEHPAFEWIEVPLEPRAVNDRRQRRALA
jgi:hypothetical protein